MEKLNITDIASKTLRDATFDDLYVSAENLLSVLNEHEAQISLNKEDILSANIAVSSNRKLIEEAQGDLDMLETSHGELETKVSIVEESLNQEIKTTTESFDSLNKEIEHLDGSLDELANEVADIPRITVDKEIDYSQESENPVENTALAKEFLNKQDLIIDAYNGIGEMWGAGINKKDGQIAVCAEDGTYMGLFDIASQTFLKTYLPPYSTGWTITKRNMAVCYSKHANKYVMFRCGQSDFREIIYTSDDGKQWREAYIYAPEMYEGNPPGVDCINYVTKALYDEYTKLTLAVKGAALFYSVDCVNWNLADITIKTASGGSVRGTGVASLGDGRFIVWAESNEGASSDVAVTILTYEDGTFSKETVAFDDETFAQYKAATVMHPFGTEVLNGVAYAGYDSQGSYNAIYKFDPSEGTVKTLLIGNRVRCSCKTDDAIYMFAKGKTIYKITSDSDEVQAFESATTGVDAVIQGAAHNPGTNDLYLFDDEGRVWKYDVETNTGAKLDNGYIEVRSPISRSRMMSISSLKTTADLVTVIQTVNDMLTTLKS